MSEFQGINQPLGLQEQVLRVLEIRKMLIQLREMEVTVSKSNMVFRKPTGRGGGVEDDPYLQLITDHGRLWMKFGSRKKQKCLFYWGLSQELVPRSFKT